MGEKRQSIYSHFPHYSSVTIVTLFPSLTSQFRFRTAQTSRHEATELSTKEHEAQPRPPHFRLQLAVNTLHCLINHPCILNIPLHCSQPVTILLLFIFLVTILIVIHSQLRAWKRRVTLTTLQDSNKRPNHSINLPRNQFSAFIYHLGAW